jgi:nicotinate dehydrogenase subunit B
MQTKGMARRDVLKGAGALIVAFGIGLDDVAAGETTIALDPKLAGSWIAIDQDNKATVYFGKVELGQGNSTTMLQLVAEELDMDFSRVVAAPIDSSHSINQGATNSSSSIQQAGPQLRSAAAEIRQELLRRASSVLDVPADQLIVDDGVIRGGGKTITYGALVGKGRIQIPWTGKAPLKDAASYKVVGTSLPRRDIPAKINGTNTFVQHASLPDMLHGRVVRPKGQGGYGHPPSIRSIDETSIRHLPGVQIVQQRDFLGVVAPMGRDTGGSSAESGVGPACVTARQCQAPREVASCEDDGNYNA